MNLQNISEDIFSTLLNSLKGQVNERNKNIINQAKPTNIQQEVSNLQILRSVIKIYN
jgi:hypothetical protein